MKHIYEIAYFIEHQIDEGIPVVLNVNGTAVAVGYNASKMFADSVEINTPKVQSVAVSTWLVSVSIASDGSLLVICTFSASKTSFDIKVLYKSDWDSVNGKKNGDLTMFSTTCATTAPLGRSLTVVIANQSQNM